VTIPTTRYLQWAHRFFGKVPFDLATSGIRPVNPDELPPLAVPSSAPREEQGELAAAIARFNAVPEADVVATLGTSHALWLVCASLLSPGDDVLIEHPCYEPLVRAAESSGARVRFFERAEARGYRLEPSVVAASLTDKTRLVIVTNLHNPSGRRAEDAELATLAALAHARGAYLLVDEVYAPFDALVDARGVFSTSARRLAPNVIAISSLTKCFGLGAERIGWILAPGEVAERARDALLTTLGALPAAHATCALRAFASIEQLAARTRGLLGEKRARVSAWAQSQPKLSWSEPPAGLYGFATVSLPGDLTPIIERAAHERGVLVSAGVFFGVPNGFRLSWTLDEALLDEGLERLGRVLEGL
jgi:aspartate/methionine/tyrosine aminotransferase